MKKKLFTLAALLMILLVGFSGGANKQENKEAYDHSGKYYHKGSRSLRMVLKNDYDIIYNRKKFNASCGNINSSAL